MKVEGVMGFGCKGRGLSALVTQLTFVVHRPSGVRVRTGERTGFNKQLVIGITGVQRTDKEDWRSWGGRRNKNRLTRRTLQWAGHIKRTGKSGGLLKRCSGSGMKKGRDEDLD